jgi:hypothetical protein
MVPANTNVPNEAKRLLKTKEEVFPTTIKANRLFKTDGLLIQSQEVVDK